MLSVFLGGRSLLVYLPLADQHLSFFLLRKRFPYIFSVDITWVKYIGVELTPRIDLSFRNRPVVFPGGRNDLHSHSPWAPFW